MTKADEDYKSFALLTGVPFLVMSLLLMWAGLYGLRNEIDLFQSMSFDAYNTIKVVLSIIVMLFAIVSVYKGWVTEGIVFILVSVSSLTTSISIVLGYTEVTNLDAVYGFVILVCAVFMLIRKVKFRGFASLFIGLALIVPNITFGWEFKDKLSSILLIVASLIFLAYFATTIIKMESEETEVDEVLAKANDRGQGHVSDHYEVIMIIGFLMLGMMLLFDSLTEYFGQQLWNTSIPVSILLISIIALVTGAYASIKGELSEAIVIMMISILYLLSMIIIGFGDDEVPVAVEFVASTVLLTTIVAFIARHNWLLATISILAFIQGVILSPIFGGDTSLAGTMSLVEGILCIYVALSVWCVVEFKREILPLLDGYRRPKKDE